MLIRPGSGRYISLWLWLSIGCLGVLAAGFVVGLRLVTEGRAAMAASDLAFHRGDLVEALRHAEFAGLQFVPGAEHCRGAEARIEALARGAEAHGQRKFALRAWRSLIRVEEQTAYWGRAESDRRALAIDAVRRLEEPHSHESESNLGWRKQPERSQLFGELDERQVP
ncbi:MAG: hypothetical protein MK135_10810 [Polyangiaceae bacterium]|nr:hypothetical protein [Polyangiaceae bacterium]